MWRSCCSTVPFGQAAHNTIQGVPTACCYFFSMPTGLADEVVETLEVVVGDAIKA